MKTNHLRYAAVVICLLSFLTPQLIPAQNRPAESSPPNKKFELTVDSIMRGPRLVGYPPERVYWSQDSQRLYFRWKSPEEPRLKEMSLHVVNRDGTGLRRLSDDEARQAPPAVGELSKDKTMTVYAEDGDIFVFDHPKNQRRQLTRTTDAEANPHFTFDQKRIYFTRQNNLYVMALKDGLLEQLTDIRTSAAGTGNTQTAGSGRGGGQGQIGQTGQSGQTGLAATTEGQQRGTDSQEYLKKEERTLFESVRERAEQREEQEKKRKEREKRKPFNLPTGQNVVSLTLSPDGKYVIATISQSATGAKNIIVPNFLTESAYTEDITLGTKVGDTQARSRLVIVNVETGEFKNVDHGQREVAPPVRTRTELNTNEQAQRESGEAEAKVEQQQESGRQGRRAETERGQPRDRDVQLSQLQWSEDGKNAALIGRSADNKDRWVLLLDPATGKTRVLAKVHDDAWVGGPGAFTLGWLPDNERVYFQSEGDGFAHLYTVSTKGGEPTQLTSGQFEVSGVRLSNDKTKFYFTSSEGSFFERHLYSMAFAGGPRTRITTLPGNNQVDISPDDTILADLRSYSNRPPELYLLPNNSSGKGESAEIKPVTTSPIPEFSNYNWIDPPIINFKARDGATVYGRLYMPSNWKGGGPAVLFVHGAGYLQNVHRWWSSYYR
ncbi:MAG: hypothetical protein AUG74_10660, partial [Bacteroidetes bacterium 13_1_20CM_4_60_6]